MMSVNTVDLKTRIESRVQECGSVPLASRAAVLLEALGYTSDKTLALEPNTAETFLETFLEGRPFHPEKAMLAHWKSVDILFQLTDEDIQARLQTDLFSSRGKVDHQKFESYLFLAIDLKPQAYTRTMSSAAL